MDDADRHAFIHLLHRLERRHEIHCLAYCLMVTHYHLLLDGRAADLRASMQRLNGRYAQRFNLRHHRHGHVFGDRYSARPVLGERQLDETYDYIAANPGKSGLVEPWPWLWFDSEGEASKGTGTG